MKSTSSFIPFVIAFLIAGAGVYWYFSTGTGDQAPLTASGTESQAQTQFQTLVGELSPISFSTEIFSDARFNALVDLSTPVTPESMGRLDPFAVIAGVNGN